jgi:TRAP-type C4-dicarboxylate transport system permease small subunit
MQREDKHWRQNPVAKGDQFGHSRGITNVMDRNTQSHSTAPQVIKRSINLVLRIIGKVEEIALIAGIAALAMLLIMNVIGREFFRSIYFAEEVCIFLIIFTTFIGLPYAVRQGRHIRMGAIFDLMNEKVQKVFILLISFVSLIVMFIMAYLAFRYVQRVAALGKITPALLVPYWLFVVIAPIGYFFAGIQYIRTFIKNLLKKDVWLSPEHRSEYLDEVEGDNTGENVV